MMFRGEFGFLSNFAAAKVTLDGMEYPTVEHAYMAAKTLNPLERLMIQRCASPVDAKRAGRKVKLRADWDKVKLAVMENLLRQKFSIPSYQMKLKSTGDLHLQEDNTWGDRFWGVCNGVGQNHLGKLLMKIRSELV